MLAGLYFVSRLLVWLVALSLVLPLFGGLGLSVVLALASFGGLILGFALTPSIGDFVLCIGPFDQRPCPQRWPI